MRSELEMPARRAGVPVQRDQGAGVQVVAGARVAVPIRPRIVDAPINQVELGIVGARHPGGSTAGLPRVTGPGFVAGFARPRDCPKAPCPPARLRIVGIHEASHARLAAANAHHHFAANGERRHRHAIARLVVGHLCGPPFLPALDVERHQIAIERGDVQLVVQDRWPTAHASESNGLVIRRYGPFPGP